MVLGVLRLVYGCLPRQCLPLGRVTAGGAALPAVPRRPEECVPRAPTTPLEILGMDRCESSPTGTGACLPNRAASPPVPGGHFSDHSASITRTVGGGRSSQGTKRITKSKFRSCETLQTHFQIIIFLLHSSSTVDCSSCDFWGKSDFPVVPAGRSGGEATSSST